MTLIYHKNDFLYTLFPELANGDNELIISTLTAYYSYDNKQPKISILGDLVTIEIDTANFLKQDNDYRLVIALCEKGNYADAKPILSKLIEQNPTNSEYYRILGQILSDEGDQNEAINCLIDALRWDAKNNWALMMMGNIFAKYKKDIPTAMKYYDQAVLSKPDDYTSIYNIGALFFQQGKYDEAKKYLYESLKINNTYPNTHHVLALIAEQENDLHSAFYSGLQALKFNHKQDELYRKTMSLIFENAKRIVQTDEGKKIYRTYRQQIEQAGGKGIDLLEDLEIQTAAKCEFAETYHRPKHIVKFNPQYSAVEHLIMHELVHLDFVIEARKAGVNKLFTSNAAKRAAFMKRIEPTVQKLRKMQVSESDITNYANGLFDGVNLLAYNAPIDLFIEDFLYTEYPELRPYQFISLYNLIDVALKAVTEKQIIDVSPKDLVSKNKIYNIVSAMQFAELYGIDLIPKFKATKAELNEAQTFYSEYLEYRNDRQPAEEYELLQHWADDLNLSENFELVDENEFYAVNAAKKPTTQRVDTDAHASTNPSTNSATDQEIEMRQFIATQKLAGTNADVVMYMVEALHYFENMPEAEIKSIAAKIAMQGAQGFDPLKQYTVDAIPHKTFNGLQILSFCYVSFAIALPHMLMKLQLPYHEEYLLAKGMKNGEN